MADYRKENFNEILANALKEQKEQENEVLLSINDIEKFRDEMAECEGGDSYLVYQGRLFHSDMGYAFDGINIMIECLKIKYGVKDNE